MLEWLKENYDNICVVITALITFCSVVVKLTPTDKDDKILSKIISILDTFSIFNPKNKEVKDK
jgi:hypothetical protein